MDQTLAKLPTWHEGELLIQERAGVVEHMRELGQRVVRDYMPDQHRDFYSQLPFIVVGAVDDAGDAWATVLAGRPGFMVSPTPNRLDIAASVDPGDPAATGLRTGAPVGLLGIEMHTRRRNRMNGVLSQQEAGLSVAVDQSFGNCPRYIQLRDAEFVRDPAEPWTAPRHHLDGIDGPARVMIESADTFFVATYADRTARRQVDVSHRGGKPGFIRVGPDGLLTIPDFDGNLFFNTLGNILLNGRAGLIFVDYASGDVLQMTGDAQVILDSPEIAAFEGAQRLWTFRARHVMRRPGALPLRWAFRDEGRSPQVLLTGDWHQAAARLRASQAASQWRPHTVTRIVEESATIRSFYLSPADGGDPLPYQAGQHLPIRLTLPGADQPLVRTYTLSSAPSDPLFRISVRRQGVASQYLHDHVRVGDTIDARAPAGQFTLDAGQPGPAVLLAGGVGITPLLAMLRHLVHEGLRRQRMRPVILFQAARNLADRAFDGELAELVALARGAVRTVRVLGDATGAEAGRDYDAAGHIDMPLLTQALAFNDYDFYLCGPPAFTQALYDGLTGYGIADARIHAEAFGPASLKRNARTEAAPGLPAPSPDPVPVIFASSAKEARWAPGAGTLLELAESRGLDPEFSCRAGTCGTCRTRLLKGAVTYVQTPTAAVADDEVLICCAVPARQPADGNGGVHLAL